MDVMCSLKQLERFVDEMSDAQYLSENGYDGQYVNYDSDVGFMIAQYFALLYVGELAGISYYVENDFGGDVIRFLEDAIYPDELPSYEEREDEEYEEGAFFYEECMESYQMFQYQLIDMVQTLLESVFENVMRDEALAYMDGRIDGDWDAYFSTIPERVANTIRGCVGRNQLLETWLVVFKMPEWYKQLRQLRSIRPNKLSGQIIEVMSEIEKDIEDGWYHFKWIYDTTQEDGDIWFYGVLGCSECGGSCDLYALDVVFIARVLYLKELVIKEGVILEELADVS